MLASGGDSKIPTALALSRWRGGRCRDVISMLLCEQDCALLRFVLPSNSRVPQRLLETLRLFVADIKLLQLQAEAVKELRAEAYPLPSRLS